MKHFLEAGTDGACIAVFDAWALPADFDGRAADDPRQAAEAAQEAGRCFFSDTGGDGTHVLHVYLDEAVPPALMARATQVGRHDAFLLPSGRLFFTGAEYLCREDLLEPGPAVTEARVDLPPGRYLARFHQLDSSAAGSHAAKEGLSRTERRWLTALPVLMLAWLLMFVVAAIAYLNGGASVVFGGALALLALATTGAYLVERAAPYRRARSRRTELRRERSPDFILALTTARHEPLVQRRPDSPPDPR